MPVCFVPGCTSSTNQESVRLYSIGKLIKNDTLIQKCNEVIRREDKELTGSSRICELHFQEDDIIKGVLVKHPNGTEELIEKAKTNWELKQDAIPSRNLDLGIALC